MILYVLRYYPTLTETFVYREIAELRRRGVPVTIARIGARADGTLQDELPEAGVLSLPRFGWSGVAELPSVRIAPRRWLRAAWLTRQARRMGVERVHAHFAGEAAELGLAVARALQVPFSVTVHAVDLFRPRPSLPEVLRAARPVVTIADHHATVIAARSDARAAVVRTGVDPTVFTPGEGGSGLVSVGRYVPKKGIDDLVREVEALGLRLRLVSDAPTSMASTRVTIGLLPPSQVPRVLQAADCFALPCTIGPDGDRDGVPVAILEAMSTGLPIVSTTVAGIPEVVDEEVGWLIPPDRPAQLRTALEAAQDPAERRRRGAAARARVLARGWTVARQVDDLLDAWHRAMNPAVAAPYRIGRWGRRA